MKDGVKVKRFQFLIGRLKTIGKADDDYVFRKFQFLIGRLKTAVRIWPGHRQRWFQFLIGRLKTQTARKSNIQGFCFNSS